MSEVNGVSDVRDSLFDVSGRTIVVTGGLGQLGRRFTTELLSRGAQVAVLDAAATGEEDPVACFGPAAADGERLSIHAVDLRDRAAVATTLEAVTAVAGVPHGLVNNAAIDAPPDAPVEETGPFETYPTTSWDRVLGVNLTGVLHACQVIGGAMANEGRGSIVNIGSIYGEVSPDQRLYEYRRQRGETFFKPVSYSVSKSGLINFTRYMATYWAEKGVRANMLTFGGVYNGQEEAFLKAYTARVPLGRMAEPDDYVGGLVYLLSDASRYQTGSNLVIDGGWTAW